MMEHASLSPIILAGGIFLLGVFLPAASLAGDQGWTPVVATTNAASPLFAARAPRALPVPPTPPMPHAKPAAAKKRAPAAKGAVVAVSPGTSVPGPASTSTADITTGSIDVIESARLSSPPDSARLFAEEGPPPPDELITGTVDTPGSDLARGYCVNIGGAAADARAALQKAKLTELEQAIGKRIAALDAKTAEYKVWVERRDEFLKRAKGALVKIYTQMEPDAAAPQLVSMDEETAAALLLSLDPQNASAILNEMPPEKAARLTATIAGAARVPSPHGASAGAAAAPPRQGENPPQAANPNGGRS